MILGLFIYQYNLNKLFSICISINFHRIKKNQIKIANNSVKSQNNYVKCTAKL